MLITHYVMYKSFDSVCDTSNSGKDIVHSGQFWLTALKARPFHGFYRSLFCCLFTVRTAVRLRFFVDTLATFSAEPVGCTPSSATIAEVYVGCVESRAKLSGLLAGDEL